jgi:hypothetical protein
MMRQSPDFCMKKIVPCWLELLQYVEQNTISSEPSELKQHDLIAILLLMRSSDSTCRGKKVVLGKSGMP